MFAYGADSHLHVVAAEGSVDPLTTAATGRQPEVLPDGRKCSSSLRGRYTPMIDRPARSPSCSLARRYANGYMIFGRGTTLLAAPFNLQDSSIGAAIALVDNVAVELPGSGGGATMPSHPAALVYVPAAVAHELVVLGADGAERVVGQPQRSLENPRFSPDGHSIVVAARRRDGEATTSGCTTCRQIPPPVDISRRARSDLERRRRHRLLTAWRAAGNLFHARGRRGEGRSCWR